MSDQRQPSASSDFAVLCRVPPARPGRSSDRAVRAVEAVLPTGRRSWKFHTGSQGLAGGLIIAVILYVATAVSLPDEAWIAALFAAAAVVMLIQEVRVRLFGWRVHATEQLLSRLEDPSSALALLVAHGRDLRVLTRLADRAAAGEHLSSEIAAALRSQSGSGSLPR